MERKLAAILAADVVGYSRLMGDDEEGTLTALKACHDRVVDPAIARYKGRVVKLMGDGLLAEFSSAGGAVESAVDIQRSLHEGPLGLGQWHAFELESVVRATRAGATTIGPRNIIVEPALAD